MNVEISSVMLKLLNDLYRTGLWGASPEEAARRLIEEGLRRHLPTTPPDAGRKET